MTRKLWWPDDTSQKSREASLSGTHGLFVKRGLFGGRHQWRNKTLAKEKDENISERVKVRLKSFHCPIELTVGSAVALGIHLKDHRLRPKDKEIGLLMYFASFDRAIYFALGPKEYRLLRFEI